MVFESKIYIEFVEKYTKNRQWPFEELKKFKRPKKKKKFY